MTHPTNGDEPRTVVWFDKDDRMTKHLNLMMRKLTPLLTAGVLLQTGGCEFDTANLSSGLITSIANSLISSFVFGLFGLV